MITYINFQNYTKMKLYEPIHRKEKKSYIARLKEFSTELPQFKLGKISSSIRRAKISCSKTAAIIAYKFYGCEIDMYESFYVMFLNNSNNTIGYAKISDGGITGTLVDIRIVAHYAVSCFAVGAILVHNHPSGTLVPSEADKQITRKIKEGLSTLDIKVLDHLILTSESGYVSEWCEPKYFSFADEGLI